MKMRNAHENLVVKPEMKRQLETWACIEINDINDPKLTQCEIGCKWLRVGDRTI
jgi:hypothetical protein